MPAADSDEVPAGILRPFVDEVAASDVQLLLLRGEPAEAVIEHAVDLAPLVDPGVLRRRVDHELAQAPDRRDWVDALPKQVIGSISAPTCVAPVFSTRRTSVAGLKTMLCGCISMATLASRAAARERRGDSKLIFMKGIGGSSGDS